MSSTNDVRNTIKASIDGARKGVADRVEALDRKFRGDIDRLRGDLDLGRLAGENAPQLVAAGVATGIVLGYALPRPLLRILQISVAVGVATVVATQVADRVACELDAAEGAEQGPETAE
ncbi:MAG: hypothetical protein NDJ92_04055 [Thermoanaerobaculia bacterium]|nr:hypothetical protein [Thermoanaerobaculia bacterium]